MSVIGGRVRAPWEMSQESSRSCGGRHKPPLVLTLTPAVAPRALLAGVAEFARASRRARGGAGGVPGATTAPLDQLLDLYTWAIYCITNTKLPRRSFSLHFRPPNGPAAAEYLDTPPAIARPSLLRLEIAAGLSHRELTPLTESRRPLARRRPHRQYTVVCVCVRAYECVYVCMFVFVYVPNVLSTLSIS